MFYSSFLCPFQGRLDAANLVGCLESGAHSGDTVHNNNKDFEIIVENNASQWHIIKQSLSYIADFFDQKITSESRLVYRINGVNRFDLYLEYAK